MKDFDYLIGRLFFFIGVFTTAIAVSSFADYSSGIRFIFSFSNIKWIVTYYVALASIGFCLCRGRSRLFKVVGFHLELLLRPLIVVVFLIAICVTMLAGMYPRLGLYHIEDGRIVSDPSGLDLIFGYHWSWQGFITWSYFTLVLLLLFYHFGAGDVAIPYTIIGVVVASWLWELPIAEIAWSDFTWVIHNLYPLYIATPLIGYLYLVYSFKRWVSVLICGTPFIVFMFIHSVFISSPPDWLLTDGGVSLFMYVVRIPAVLLVFGLCYSIAADMKPVGGGIPREV